MVLSTRWLFNFEGTALKRVEDDRDTSYCEEYEGRLRERFTNPVTIAERLHLFPSRTQKLSTVAAKIAQANLARCRVIESMVFHRSPFFYTFYVKLVLTYSAFHKSYYNDLVRFSI